MAGSAVVAATGKPWPGVEVLDGGSRPWPTVVLTYSQLVRAAELGLRQYEKSKNHPAFGAPLDPDLARHLNILGRQCEFAVAAYYGAPEPTESTGRLLDVGERTQVRGVTKAHHGLLHRPTDKPTEIFVNVLAMPPFFGLRGWLPGAVCRNEKWWRTPNGRPGCWMVPVDQLAPISSLEAVNL